MNWRSKRDRRRKKREAEQAAVRARVLAVFISADPFGGPCPDAGSGMGQPCPRCGRREVKEHVSSCDQRWLECCWCRYVPSQSEAELIVARAERDSTGTG